MTRWIATVAAGLAGLTISTTASAIAASQAATKHQPSAQATDLGARRHHRHARRVHRIPPYEPRYYARPYDYRPYAYALPYPFVLGVGPRW